MQTLVAEIKTLQNNKELEATIRQRLETFSSFKDKPKEEWFSELCFCLLAANAKSRTAWNIQQELQYIGFAKKSQEDLAEVILRNKHRFHNNKAKFIVNARQYQDIKSISLNLIKDVGEKGAREWLSRNVQGFGMKEASHFLRNTGVKNVAIVDRHVLNVLLEHQLVKEKPHTLTRGYYLMIEETLEKVCKEIKMTQAELDMYLWYMKTGEVLK